MKQLTSGSDADRAAAIDRYLTLLKSGGSDHPMTLLQRAGVDLSQPETVRAVVDQLDRLVTQLETRDRQASRYRSIADCAAPTRSAAASRYGCRCFARDAQHRVRRADARVHHHASVLRLRRAPPHPRSRFRSAATTPSRQSSPHRRRSTECPRRGGRRRRCRCVSGTSMSDGYERSPRTSVSRGLTGITLVADASAASA